MQQRKVNDHEQALINLLGVPSQELKRHSPTVYEWRGIYYEVLTREQVRNGKVPASWYSSLGDWRIREMGRQATKVIKIRKKDIRGNMKVTVSANKIYHENI